jgi:branched-chain amino acid transport system permease protein/neutral amino acid transport system permease protein
MHRGALGVVLQFLFNGIVQASILVLGAMGLSLVYGGRKFANFAHAEMLTLGAYFTLLLIPGTRNLVSAALVAALFVAAVGIVQELLVYARLEGRGPVASLVASVGVALILQNSVAASWGPSIVSYGVRYPDNVLFLGGAISANAVRDLIPVAVGFASAGAILLYLKFAKLGKAMRATADNRDLARVSGVNTRVVDVATWMIAGAAAGIAGVLVAIKSVTFQPITGATLLLPLFAAVIVGGIGSPPGAILGSILVGVSQSLFFYFSLLLGVDPRWQVAVPFALLVIVLLVRPRGLLGRAVGAEIRPLRTEVAEMIRSIRRGLS